ncbi:MAG: pyruvate kinase [Magnetococcales bacterium]|nr:pyruvate kinase [Magnetococcales bacterium]
MSLSRRAKIIATLGPACDQVENISRLIQAGMNVARVNMSHGTLERQDQTIANIRQAALNVGCEVAVLMDLQGPKIRVGALDHHLLLKEGQHWVIGPEREEDNYPEYANRYIPTTHHQLAEDTQAGCRILFDDGLIIARAVGIDRKVVKIIIENGAPLKSHKGINLPDSNISAPSLTEKDKRDLFFGIDRKVDYVALSFVRTAKCVMEVKYLLHAAGIFIPVVAKIERPEALDHLEEIIHAADAVMVARGDLAVEVGNHRVPTLQRQIIQLCRNHGKPVITATQMLESMIHNPSPTRAEASDVANAIWDGTDAVMLSGETSMGKYPYLTISTMSRIIEDAEGSPRSIKQKVETPNISTATMEAATLIAERVKAKWIIATTRTGNSCWEIARFRPEIPVLGVASNLEAVRRMCLFWGITPQLFDDSQEESADIDQQVLVFLVEREELNKGDTMVLTREENKIVYHGIASHIRVEMFYGLADQPSDLPLDYQDISRQPMASGNELTLDHRLCVQCKSCVETCPYNIYLQSDSNQDRIELNRKQIDKCTRDGACVRVCPVHAIQFQEEKSERQEGH